MKNKGRILILIALMLFLFGCSMYTIRHSFAPRSVIKKVRAHIVSIATYYEMSEQEYFYRLKRAQKAKRYWDMPIFVKKDKETQRITVAYLGSGTILKDNHVLTVNHLFDKFHQDNTYNLNIWVVKEGIDHFIKASLVARSKCEETEDKFDDFKDYAILKLEEDLGLPGLKIAKHGKLKDGNKVIFSGSTQGLAFFTRFGYVTRLQFWFYKNLEGKFNLSSWHDFPFWTVYPGGPGDSGGSVVNTKAKLVTVMYCGVTISSEEYIFGNPTKLLWDFLKKHNLEYLGK